MKPSSIPLIPRVRILLRFQILPSRLYEVHSFPVEPYFDPLTRRPLKHPLKTVEHQNTPLDL